MPDLDFASDEQWSEVLGSVECLRASVKDLQPRERSQDLHQVAASRQLSAEEGLAEEGLRRRLDEAAGMLGEVEKKIRLGRVLTSYCRAQQRSEDAPEVEAGAGPGRGSG